MQDWWLKRCDRTPWRAFLMLWLVLLLLVVLLGFGGFVYETQPDSPPPKAAVDYEAFIPGGYARGDFELDVEDPLLLPVFDPALTQRWTSDNLEPWSMSIDPPGDGFDARVIMMRPLLAARFGWPMTFVELNRIQSWDVSDPFANEFGYAPHTWESHWRWHRTTLGWLRASENESSAFGGNVFVSPIALTLLLTQLTAGIAVSLSCFVSRRRTRRRIRLRRCVECGHQLGPTKSLAKCPECGTDVSTTNPIIKKNRFGRAFVVVLAVLVFGCVVVTLLSGKQDPPEDIAQRLRRDQEEIDRNGSTYWFWKPLTLTRYGYPTVFRTVTGTWLRLSPNSDPVRGLHPTLKPGPSLEWTDDELIYFSIDPVALQAKWSIFGWGVAAIELVVLEFITFILSVVFIVMRRVIKRHRHAPRGE